MGQRVFRKQRRMLAWNLNTGRGNMHLLICWLTRVATCGFRPILLFALHISAAFAFKILRILRVKVWLAGVLDISSLVSYF